MFNQICHILKIKPATSNSGKYPLELPVPDSHSNSNACIIAYCFFCPLPLFTQYHDNHSLGFLWWIFCISNMCEEYKTRHNSLFHNHVKLKNLNRHTGLQIKDEGFSVFNFGSCTCWVPGPPGTLHGLVYFHATTPSPPWQFSLITKYVLSSGNQ